MTPILTLTLLYTLYLKNQLLNLLMIFPNNLPSSNRPGLYTIGVLQDRILFTVWYLVCIAYTFQIYLNMPHSFYICVLGPKYVLERHVSLECFDSRWFTSVVFGGLLLVLYIGGPLLSSLKYFEPQVFKPFSPARFTVWQLFHLVASVSIAISPFYPFALLPICFVLIVSSY